MRKNWLIALVGAALLAIVPASAIAQGHHHGRHHAKRHHRVRTQLRHITAASSSTAPGTGTNPGTTSPSGSPDNAGTVTSFEGTKLVMTLNDGSTVSGVVNSDTELQCESTSAQASGDSGSMQADLSRDGGGDQNSGDTQSSSGDPTAGAGQDDQNDQAGQNDQVGQNDPGDQGDQAGAGNGAACTTASLAPGTVVHDAELAVSGSGAVWHQIDLVIG